VPKDYSSKLFEMHIDAWPKGDTGECPHHVTTKWSVHHIFALPELNPLWCSSMVLSWKQKITNIHLKWLLQLKWNRS